MLLILGLAGCTSANHSTGAASAVDATSVTQPSAAPSIPAGVSTVTLTRDHVQRRFVIDRPSAGAHRRGVVIFLHGSKNTAMGIRATLNLTAQAAHAGILAVYPDGDLVTQSWRTGCCSSYADSGLDVQWIERVIKYLVGDGEANGDRVVVAGFSAGALLANVVACRLSSQVSAVVSVAGSLLSPPAFVRAAASPAERTCTPVRRITVLEIHGASDTVLPMVGSTRACRTSACGPGVNGYLASVPTVLSWWRRIDGCAPAVTHNAATASTSLAQCPNGKVVGLATVARVGHNLTELRTQFAVGTTLVNLATGRPLGW